MRLEISTFEYLHDKGDGTGAQPIPSRQVDVDPTAPGMITLSLLDDTQGGEGEEPVVGAVQFPVSAWEAVKANVDAHLNGEAGEAPAAG